MRERAPPPEAVSPVAISADTVTLQGEFALPTQAGGVVLFAHGSGSSRHSPRNTYVAGVLREAGLGTLLFDLLTTAEDRDYATRFDIPLLTSRLVAATQWILRETPATALPIVPGATHLFEEPGTLEQVAALAADWFVRWLGARGRTLNS